MQLLFVLEPWKNDKAEVLANSNEAHKLDQQQLASGTVFGWGVYSHGSSRLPVAPIDSQQLLRLQTHAVRSLPMTPTDFHLLPPRQLTPQPYSSKGTVLPLTLNRIDFWLLNAVQLGLICSYRLHPGFRALMIGSRLDLSSVGFLIGA